MWYFAWILGVLMACFAAIINAMWLEFEGYPAEDPPTKLPSPPEHF